jgi:hypothetical protein
MIQPLRYRLAISGTVLLSLGFMTGCPSQEKTKFPDNPVPPIKDKPDAALKPGDKAIEPPK